jgi:hypothetical protein
MKFFFVFFSHGKGQQASCSTDKISSKSKGRKRKLQNTTLAADYQPNFSKQVKPNKLEKKKIKKAKNQTVSAPLDFGVPSSHLDPVVGNKRAGKTEKDGTHTSGTTQNTASASVLRAGKPDKANTHTSGTTQHTASASVSLAVKTEKANTHTSGTTQNTASASVSSVFDFDFDAVPNYSIKYNLRSNSAASLIEGIPYYTSQTAFFAEAKRSRQRRQSESAAATGSGEKTDSAPRAPATPHRRGRTACATRPATPPGECPSRRRRRPPPWAPHACPAAPRIARCEVSNRLPPHSTRRLLR